MLITLLFSLLVLLAVSVFPVMLAARLVDAPRRGFGPALLASFLYYVIAMAAEQLVGESWAAWSIGLALGTVMLSIVLEIGLLKAFGVALLIMAIQLVVVMTLLAAALAPAAGA